MTRDDFGREFMRAMRFVIQKHDRAIAAQADIARMGRRRGLQAAYDEAQTNLDAAILQLSDHVYDAMEQMTERRPERADAAD